MRASLSFDWRKGQCLFALSAINVVSGLCVVTKGMRLFVPLSLARKLSSCVRERCFRISVSTIFISLIRMRSKRDIKMGRLCTPGGAVLGIVGGGVTFRFLNGEAILDENMLFWVRLYALVVVLKILLDFRL